MGALIKRYGKILIVFTILLAVLAIMTFLVCCSIADSTETEVILEEPSVSETPSDVPAETFVTKAPETPYPPEAVNENPAGIILDQRWEEVTDARDKNYRHWRVIKEIETTDPVTGEKIVEERITKVAEVGSGISYRDAEGKWQLTDTAWRQTAEGFVMDRANYVLMKGLTADSILRFIIDETELYLRPDSISVSDDTKTQTLAFMQSGITGQIDSQSPNILIFNNAFGPGIDLEVEALASGYHQNVVFRTKPQLPIGFSPENSKVTLFTEVYLGSYLGDWVDAKVKMQVNYREEVANQRVIAEYNYADLEALTSTPFTTDSIDFITEREGAEPKLSHRFGRSWILEADESGRRSRKNRYTQAEKQIFRDTQNGKYFLAEQLDAVVLAEAAYPLVWDYTEEIDTDFGDDIWYADTTYFIMDDVDCTGTLRIEPGTVVKFLPDATITENGLGTIQAVGKPYDYIYIASIHDDSVGEVYAGSQHTPQGYWAFECTGRSTFQFCKFMDATSAISCLPDCDPDRKPICNNIFMGCDYPIDIWFTNGAGSDGSYSIHNNLFIDGITAIYYDNSDSNGGVNVDIYNNTIDDFSYYGIWIAVGDYDLVHIRTNLFTNITSTSLVVYYDEYAVEEEPSLHHNGYYSCGTPQVTGCTQSYPINLTYSPYDAANTLLGSYFLNDDAGAGAELVDINIGDVSNYYDDPCAWSVYPVTASGYYFDTDTTISANTEWAPNYATCDTGNIDIGYHHPRVDYLLDQCKITVQSPWTLTVKPGTVIAHNAVTGIGGGDDCLYLPSGSSLICEGNPYREAGKGYITWTRYNLADMGASVCYYDNYNQAIRAEGNSHYDITGMVFRGLSSVLLAAVGPGGSLRDCQFIRNEGVFSVIMYSSGNTIENCLFVQNQHGLGGPVNGSVSNCTFEQCDYGAYNMNSGTIFNCIFSNNMYGIYGTNPSENNNLFYGNTTASSYSLAYSDFAYPGQSNAQTIDVEDDPFIAATQWTDFADRLYLNQELQAIDNGDESGGMPYYTTNVDGISEDVGIIDIGYHYPARGEDSDGDGLYDGEEVLLGLNPFNVDSDGDGLVDGAGDLVSIYDYAGGYDADSDGFVDGEADLGTDPADEDSDGDGIADGWEHYYDNADPLNAGDASNNEDGDYLTNYYEYYYYSQFGIDLNPEVDNDGDFGSASLYDDAGSVTSQRSYEIRSGVGLVWLAEAQYDYDNIGRRWRQRQLADPGGSTSNTDDAIVLTAYNVDGGVKKSIVKGIGGTNPDTYQSDYDIQTQYAYDVHGRQTQVTDPAGQATSYIYDSFGNMVTTSLPGGREMYVAYDYAGRATKQTNVLGDYNVVSYNSRGQTIKSIFYDNDGPTAVSQQRWSYNNVGDVVQQAQMADAGSTATDPCTTTDRVVDYVRDYASESRELMTLTYSGANTITASRQLTDYLDPTGRGLPTQVYRGEGTGQPYIHEEVDYDDAGRLVQKTQVEYDATGSYSKTVASAMAYDDYGRMTAAYQVGVSENLTTFYTYDGMGRKVIETNPNDIDTIYSYDGMGRMTRMTEDPTGLNRITDYVYNRLGQLEQLLAYDGQGQTQTTSYAYDLMGRQTWVEYPDEGTVAYQYDVTGQVTQRLDQRSIITAYSYDLAGQLTKKQNDPTNPTLVEKYAYDARGLMLTAKKGTSDVNDDTIAVSAYSYDDLGSLILAEQKIGASTKVFTTEYDYNQLGQVTRLEYPVYGGVNQTLAYTYTGLGKINTIHRDPDSANVLLVTYHYYGFNTMDRMYNNVTDDIIYQVVYDDFGRPTRHYTYENTGTPTEIADFTYIYDDNGNIITQTFAHRPSDPYNLHAYDNLDRLTQTDYLVGVLTEDEQFVYDSLGNRVSANLRNGGEVRYEHNLANEYTAIGDPIAYWKLNETSGTTAEDSTGENEGTLINFSTPTWTTGMINGALEFDGENDGVAVGTGLDKEDFGGADGQITIMAWVKPDTLSKYNAITSYIGGVYYFSAGTTTVSKLRCMVYNATQSQNYWPTSTSTITANEWSHVVFVFDAGNNTYQFFINGEPDDPVTAPVDLVLYNYSTGTKYIGYATFTSNGITSYFDGTIDDVRIYDRVLTAEEIAAIYSAGNDEGPVYDNAGNLAVDHRGYQYSYDYENRLTKIETNSGAVAEYTYDGLGRRIESIVHGATNVTRRYYYDSGWRVLAETDESDDLQREYVYGNYLDEVLLVKDAVATKDYYYVHDHLYSPVALLEDDGDVIERYEYDAYGKRSIYDASFNTRTSSNYDLAIAFTGQRLDTLDDGDLEIMYYKNRYYDPEMGRFLTQDPIGYADGMNLYEYVSSRSIISVDPLGLMITECPVVGKLAGKLAGKLEDFVESITDHGGPMGDITYPSYSEKDNVIRRPADAYFGFYFNGFELGRNNYAVLSHGLIYSVASLPKYKQMIKDGMSGLKPPTQCNQARKYFPFKVKPGSHRFTNFSDVPTLTNVRSFQVGVILGSFDLRMKGSCYSESDPAVNCCCKSRVVCDINVELHDLYKFEDTYMGRNKNNIESRMGRLVNNGFHYLAIGMNTHPLDLITGRINPVYGEYEIKTQWSEHIEEEICICNRKTSLFFLILAQQGL